MTPGLHFPHTMGRARTSETARARTKSAALNEIVRGIQQLQDILTAIEDFSKEGFPYRDAAKAKAELQFRNCLRQVFGERSPEFQTYRNHRIRIGSAGETGQSIAVVKTLIERLDQKKRDTQNGVTSSPSNPPAGERTAARTRLTLVPPSTPTAKITMPQPPATPAAPDRKSTRLNSSHRT